MFSVQVACPACKTMLRLPGATPTGRVRCPKCKELFAPVIEAEVMLDESESVAVVLDSGPPEPPRDPDRSFFEWIADAKDPLDKKPAPAPKPEPLEAEAELPYETVPDEPARPRRPRREEDERVGSNNGVVIALIACMILVGLGGFAGASYIVYSFWPGRTTAEGDPSTKPDDTGKSAKVAEPVAIAKVKAATVLVRTHYPEGQTTTATGFFVPGPGLVLTNARLAGQGKKPVPVLKIEVICGKRSLSARVLGSDGDLDLALLQVASLDLPEPLALNADTFTVKEPQAAVVFAAPTDGDAKPATWANVNISGSRDVSGMRPWFLLGGWVPPGSWGGPVTDSACHVIGVSGIVPGSETATAVPVETVLVFVKNTVNAVESSGPVAMAPPEKKKPEFDDTPQFPNAPFPNAPFGNPPGFAVPPFGGPLRPGDIMPGRPPRFQPIVPPGFPPPIGPPRE